MDERKRARALAQCMALRSASRLHAQGALLLAGAREREALAAREGADAITSGAAQAWRTHIEAGRFHPELAGTLAHDLNLRVAEGEEARAHARRASGARNDCEADWRARDAECRQIEALLDDSRRALSRVQERRNFEAVEDRIVFAWSGR